MAFLMDLVKAMTVRLVLLVHSFLVIWLATSMTQRREYWLLAVADVGLVVEGLVTIVANKAKEWKWWCPCFFFYLCSTIPGIWILELNRMDVYQQTKDAVNITAQVLDDISGVHIPIEMETDTWVVIMEQLFLYLMILGRWILPRGEISRDELSQLLFVMIGIASDITELFALFEEDKVRNSTDLTYAILCVWTLSLFQFTFVLTTTHSPKKTRVALSNRQVIEVEIDEPKESCLKHFFQTEVWSICINFLFQDGPFLCVRMYTMVAMRLLTYTIIFFTAKNALLVLLLIYRLSVLCCNRRKGKEGSVSLSSIPSKQSIPKSASQQSVGSAGRIGSAGVFSYRQTPDNMAANGMGSRHSSNTSLSSGGRRREVYTVPL